MRNISGTRNWYPFGGLLFSNGEGALSILKIGCRRTVQ
jgi:hypothetical protein